MTVFTVRNPDGSIWACVMYRDMADAIAAREPERGLTVHEEFAVQWA